MYIQGVETSDRRAGRTVAIDEPDRTKRPTVETGDPPPTREPDEVERRPPPRRKRGERPGDGDRIQGALFEDLFRRTP